MGAQKKTFIITRFDPDKDSVPRKEKYEIPVESHWKVLDAVNYIKDEVDSTLSHRWSCRMAVCGSCGMSVNGEPKLTCKTALSDYGDTVEIAPLANFPVVRDLVVELEAFIEKFHKVKPWIIRDDVNDITAGPYKQSVEDLNVIKQFSMCINCMLCYAACPQVGLNPDFIGPAALALAHRYNEDSRDRGASERRDILLGTGGTYDCTFANECSEVCPKEVDPAIAIQREKFLGLIHWARNFVSPKKGGR